MGASTRASFPHPCPGELGALAERTGPHALHAEFYSSIAEIKFPGFLGVSIIRSFTSEEDQTHRLKELPVQANPVTSL